MRNLVKGPVAALLLVIGGLFPLACDKSQVNPMAPDSGISAERLRKRTPTPTPTRTFTPGSPTFTRTPSFTWTPGTPTSTWTRTFTGTPGTPTSTSTPTWTLTPIGCSSTSTWGDSAASASTLNLSSSTFAQRYDLAQASTLRKIWIQAAAPANVRIGIYTGSSGSAYPGTLLYASSYQTLSAGLNAFVVPGIPLSAGTYWLAYEAAGSAVLAAASGSTALRATVVLPFPCNWLACGYTSCSAPSCSAGPGTPTCTPTPLCTPPPTGTASNQVVIYAETCQ